MFRRFLIAVLIFLIAVVVVADRVGAIVGAHVLAGKVKTDEQLSSRPNVNIGGFPFLTQAISGKYKNVTITANNVALGGLNVTTVTAHLFGVHLPLGQALHGSVSQVPVDRVQGTAFISFADVNSYLAGKHLTIRVSPGSAGKATVTDRVESHGKRVSLTGLGAVTVGAKNVLHVRVSQLSGARKAGPHAINFAVPLTDIPFRINIASVSVTSTGLSASGGAVNIVLGLHPV